MLFVDKAYRLREGRFVSKTIDELVDIITKPKFFGKVVIIFVDYNNDMNRLIAANLELLSRFSEEIIFRDITSNHYLRLLDRRLKEKKISVTALREKLSTLYREITSILKKLSCLSF